MVPRGEILFQHPIKRMIELKIDAAYAQGNYASRLKDAAAAALNTIAEDTSPNLTIVLTGDDQLQKLNREHLGIDKPTDVLSFPAEDGEYLGDVLISHPHAAAQAIAGGHTIEQELELLTVHAVLHLLGFGHAGDTEKDRMWSVQGEILASLGNPLKP